MNQDQAFKIGEIVQWTWKGRRSPTLELTGRVIAIVHAGQRPDPREFAAALRNSDYPRRRTITSYVVEADGVQYWPYAWKLKRVSAIETSSAPQGGTGTAAPTTESSPEPRAPTVRDAIRLLSTIAATHGDDLPLEKAIPLFNADLPWLDFIPNSCPGVYPVKLTKRRAANVTVDETSKARA